MFKRLIASLVCLTFIFSNLQYVQAQDFSVNQLPIPGTMVGESEPFSPLALKGLIVNLQKPLEFQFIVDTGKGPQDRTSIKEEANQLVKYFLAGLTIPEGDLWVNLSPYEKSRMVSIALGQTDLGRDLLAQDYILKQLTATLIHPEKSLGKVFWNKVYAKAQAQFGTTNIPVNTFNKVWILPDQAQVYENVNAAYVTQSTLKVMLDEDYLALHKHLPKSNVTDSIGSQIVRAIILPEIEKEVNTGKNFAPLRQIYQALILAKWYKETIQNGLLDAIYTNKNKVAGVNVNDPRVKEQIYERYLKAYKKGAFNYIKDEPSPDGQVIPRKYFSGGTLMIIPLKDDGTEQDVESQRPNGAMVALKVLLAKDSAMMNQTAEVPNNIHLDFDVTTKQIAEIVQGRVLGTTIQPELVSESNLSVPNDYKRVRQLEAKIQYRESLMRHLVSQWEASLGPVRARELANQFEDLSVQLDDDGAIVFGDLIDRTRFAQLVGTLDNLMETKGSKSLLHSYLNLRNHPEFLTNRNFNGAFIHPLLIALMSYRIGGPVRVVDVRSKDTGPITARAQDNMLHIDNTPFNDEYKILVNWRQGQAVGPSGQNFVFLPGTHRGFRQSFKGVDGHAWATENGSIFITDPSVNQLLDFQQSTRGANSVVEIQSDKPTSTLFAAGSLVHHRYRTKEGSPRSCIIVAFQPAMDNPGEFIHGFNELTGETGLEQLLFGYQNKESTPLFMRALLDSIGEITSKLIEIADPNSPSVTLKIAEKRMDLEQIAQWRAVATDAPTIEELKKRDQKFPLGDIPHSDLMQLLGNSLMFYDKHGPLDLILYYDSHEESRKWARNRIREMHLNDLQQRLALWDTEIQNPSLNDLLTPQQTIEISSQLLARIKGLTDAEKAGGHVDAYEKISPTNAYQSVYQLIDDLSEAISRCDSLQNFLSTSLFVFWAADELYRLMGANDPEIKKLGGVLLRSYIATAIVENKKQANAAMLMGQVNLDMNIKPTDFDDIFKRLVTGQRIEPELVTAEQLKHPQDYKMLQETEKKQSYRRSLFKALRSKWVEAYGEPKAEELSLQFLDLNRRLEEDGSLIIGDLINRANFARFVEVVDKLLDEHKIGTKLNDFLNLKNYPDMLVNKDFNGSYVHPLLIALISYRLGGPIRVVDSRIRKTPPSKIDELDNNLHIDHSPFSTELRVIVNWETGKASGPQGQNFVFLPGTHLGYRNTSRGSDGKARSYVGSSVFFTGRSIDNVLAFQQQVYGRKAVVELTSEKPTTTIFDSGRLVHHRFRTENDRSRTNITITFHLVQDDAGTFIKELSDKLSASPLERIVFGSQDEQKAGEFQSIVADESETIAKKIDELFDRTTSAKVIEPMDKFMSKARQALWRKTLLSTPSVADLKTADRSFPIGQISHDEYLDLLTQHLMFYDKNGTLDLVLYNDSHEVIRKWAINKVRGMTKLDLRDRLREWEPEITEPRKEDLLTPHRIEEMLSQLTGYIGSLPEVEKNLGHLGPNEIVTPQFAFQSIRQLLVDLPETINRAHSLDYFLTASLFAFWSVDLLNRLHGKNSETLRRLGGQLLRHYIATAVFEREYSKLKHEEAITNAAMDANELISQALAAVSSGEIDEYNRVSKLLHGLGYVFDYPRDNHGNLVDENGSSSDAQGHPLFDQNGNYYGNGRAPEKRWYKSDSAMWHTFSPENGGIDLNQINFKRNGKTIKVQFDPAQLNQIVKGGFKGFSFKIESMAPISSPFQLLGINRNKEPELLAKL